MVDSIAGDDISHRPGKKLKGRSFGFFSVAQAEIFARTLSRFWAHLRAKCAGKGCLKGMWGKGSMGDMDVLSRELANKNAQPNSPFWGGSDHLFW